MEVHVPSTTPSFLHHMDNTATPSAASFPTGTCIYMCPERERREREAQKRLHPFEVLDGTEQHRLPRADPLKIVKEYARPAAGKDSTKPSDLRPPAVLLQTVQYLVDDVLPRSDVPWSQVYSFVFDRLRAVRQDMTIQRVGGEVCVAILEKCLGFLLCAGYRLCEAPLCHFDPRINDTHVQECFGWLCRCYRSGMYEQEAEYQALFLLYNLGSLEALCQALLLPTHIRKTPEVRMAMAVNRAYLEGNFPRFFRLLRQLSPLQSCSIHRHVAPCQRQALLIFSHGFSSKNCRYPLDRLAQLLGFESQLQATQFCQQHGLTIVGNSVVFLRSAFKDPGAVLHAPSYKLVDKKLGLRTWSEIINEPSLQL
ncbi:SAC3 domain-containing protein 1 [Lissotriton helveticus]